MNWRIKMKTSIKYNYKISKIKLRYFKWLFSLINTIFEIIKHRMFFYTFSTSIFNQIQCLKTMFLWSIIRINKSLNSISKSKLIYKFNKWINLNNMIFISKPWSIWICVLKNYIFVSFDYFIVASIWKTLLTFINELKNRICLFASETLTL